MNTTPQPLTKAGLQSVTATLEVGLPELWTVLSVETRGCGFLPDTRPLILFERHIFHQLTRGRFSSTDPGISSPTPGGYGNADGEHTRLAQAVRLDRAAALQSASWGIGQVMGFHYRICGYPDVETMVAGMRTSEDAQLSAMARFLVANHLHRPLAAHDWTAFARSYNGPAFARNQYDTRLKAEYQRLAAGPLPDLSTRAAQVRLMFLGLYRGAVDGQAGPRTLSAVAEFRRSKKLPISDGINQALLENLAA